MFIELFCHYWTLKLCLIFLCDKYYCYEVLCAETGPNLKISTLTCFLFMKRMPEIGHGKARHDLESRFAEEVRHSDWKSYGALDPGIAYCLWSHSSLPFEHIAHVLCIWKLGEQRWVSFGLTLKKINPSLSLSSILGAKLGGNQRITTNVEALEWVLPDTWEICF